MANPCVRETPAPIDVKRSLSAEKSHGPQRPQQDQSQSGGSTQQGEDSSKDVPSAKVHHRFPENRHQHPSLRRPPTAPPPPPQRRGNDFRHFPSPSRSAPESSSPPIAADTRAHEGHEDVATTWSLDSEGRAVSLMHSWHPAHSSTASAAPAQHPSSCLASHRQQYQPPPPPQHPATVNTNAGTATGSYAISHHHHHHSRRGAHASQHQFRPIRPTHLQPPLSGVGPGAPPSPPPTLAAARQHQEASPPPHPYRYKYLHDGHGFGTAPAVAHASDHVKVDYRGPSRHPLPGRHHPATGITQENHHHHVVGHCGFPPTSAQGRHFTGFRHHRQDHHDHRASPYYPHEAHPYQRCDSYPSAARRASVSSHQPPNLSPRFPSDSAENTTPLLKTNTRTASQKGCSCRKTRCLKLYCQCFAASVLCSTQLCICEGCQNTPEEMDKGEDGAIAQARKAVLIRNPNAFEDKFLESRGSGVPHARPGDGAGPKAIGGGARALSGSLPVHLPPAMRYNGSVSSGRTTGYAQVGYNAERCGLPHPLGHEPRTVLPLRPLHSKHERPAVTKRSPPPWDGTVAVETSPSDETAGTTKADDSASYKGEEEEKTQGGTESGDVGSAKVSAGTSTCIKAVDKLENGSEAQQDADPKSGGGELRRGTEVKEGQTPRDYSGDSSASTTGTTSLPAHSRAGRNKDCDTRYSLPSTEQHHPYYSHLQQRQPLTGGGPHTVGAEVSGGAQRNHLDYDHSQIHPGVASSTVYGGVPPAFSSTSIHQVPSHHHHVAAVNLNNPNDLHNYPSSNRISNPIAEQSSLPVHGHAVPPPHMHQMAKVHRVGCKCKKSRCLKKYCECFSNNSWCGASCKCEDCGNRPPESTLNGQGPVRSVGTTATSFDTSSAVAPHMLLEMSPGQNQHLHLVSSEEEKAGSSGTGAGTSLSFARPSSVPSLGSHPTLSSDAQSKEDGGQLVAQAAQQLASMTSSSSNGEKLDFLATLASSALDTLNANNAKVAKKEENHHKRKAHEIDTASRKELGASASAFAIEQQQEQKKRHSMDSQNMPHKKRSMAEHQQHLHDVQHPQHHHSHQQQMLPKQQVYCYDQYRRHHLREDIGRPSYHPRPAYYHGQPPQSPYYPQHQAAGNQQHHLGWHCTLHHGDARTGSTSSCRPQFTRHHLSSQAPVPVATDPSSSPPSTGDVKSKTGNQTADVKLHKLPKGLTYRKVCSHCGRQRAEHGEFGFGSKCPFTTCGRCGANEEMHRCNGQPMGVLCALAEDQGAESGASDKYDIMLADLAARAEIQAGLSSSGANAIKSSSGKVENVLCCGNGAKRRSDAVAGE